MSTSEKFRENLNVQQFKVIQGDVDDFGTNRKRICEFLLVINSNFGPILHRLWDTATYWLKIAYFSYPSLNRWRFGLVVTSLGTSTKLLYAEPG